MLHRRKGYTERACSDLSDTMAMITESPQEQRNVLVHILLADLSLMSAHRIEPNQPKPLDWLN